jgi:hypothetical protein
MSTRYHLVPHSWIGYAYVDLKNMLGKLKYNSGIVLGRPGNRKIITANAGDSRIIIGYEEVRRIDQCNEPHTTAI